MTILFENQVPFGANILRFGKTIGIGRTTTPLAGLKTTTPFLLTVWFDRYLSSTFLALSQTIWPLCLTLCALFQVPTRSVFFFNKVEVLLQVTHQRLRWWVSRNLTEGRDQGQGSEIKLRHRHHRGECRRITGEKALKDCMWPSCPLPLYFAHADLPTWARH